MPTSPKCSWALVALVLFALPLAAQDGPSHDGPPGHGPPPPGAHGGPEGGPPGGPHGPPPGGGDHPDGPPAPEGPPRFLSEFEWDPAIPRGLQLNTPEASPGITLIAPINDMAAYALDLDGAVVHTWQFDSAPGEWMYLLDDGNLLRAGRVDDEQHFRGGGIGGVVELVAPDSSVLWRHTISGPDHNSHHDLEPLPNGNLLVIAWERKPAREAVFRGRDPAHVGQAGLWPDMVLELKPILPEGAEVVWEWHAWDHLVQDVDDKRPQHGWIAEHPGRIDINVDHRDQAPPTAAELDEQRELEAAMAQLGYVGGADEEPDAEERSRLDKSGDWMHTNGIDYHPRHDLIVMSSPELNEVYIIDHSTTTAQAAGSTGGRWGHGGDLLWRWGNPRNHGAGGDDDQVLGYQHDPSFLPDAPDGSLRLLVYNNNVQGLGEDERGRSAVLELSLPFDPERGFVGTPGEPWGPAAPDWTYEDPGRFHSAFISGAQRLPDGHTLICSGAGGRVFEVTREGELVWDYRSDLGGTLDPPDHAGHAPPFALFRATRLAPDHPGLRRVLAEAR